MEHGRILNLYEIPNLESGYVFCKAKYTCGATRDVQLSIFGHFILVVITLNVNMFEGGYMWWDKSYHCLVDVIDNIRIKLLLRF